MKFWYQLCWWICRIGLFFWHPVFHTVGRELVPNGTCILCANHSGMADPIWILLIPVNCCRRFSFCPAARIQDPVTVYLHCHRP